MLHPIRRSTGRRATRPRPPIRLTLELLETRSLLSANVLQTNLVSDLPGVAAVQDPNLVNPWGIAESPSSPGRPGSPFWIADNNAGVSTLYSVPGKNNTPVSINGLVVSIPTPVDPLGASGAPTGTVFNLDLGGGGFQVSGFSNPKTGSPAPTSAPAIFLFATEDGTIVGWNPGVNPKGFDPTKAGTYGVIAVDNSGNNFTETNPALQTGAVYKGLAIATSKTAIIADDPNSTALLYAANFRTGMIDVYDAAFHKVTSMQLSAGAFIDPNLPNGYAPFNVQVLNNQLYVTYAKQNETKHDDVAGRHHGFVDVFNLNGTPGVTKADGSMTQRLISRGVLDSPWGLAIAPASFGNLAGALLVGNFGNGHINAFNASTGAFMGELKDPDGEPIVIDHLWALRVGNDGAGGKSDTVYFTAGIFDEAHGLFGSLTPVAPGTPEGPAEAQMIQADLDVVQLNLTTVLNDIKTGAPIATLRQDIKALDASLTQLVRDEAHFAADERADLGGNHREGNDDLLDALFAELDKQPLDRN
jgi:uncharacterized protein (TIGR03118 family)